MSLTNVRIRFHCVAYAHTHTHYNPHQYLRPHQANIRIPKPGDTYTALAHNLYIHSAALSPRLSGISLGVREGAHSIIFSYKYYDNICCVFRFAYIYSMYALCVHQVMRACPVCSRVPFLIVGHLPVDTHGI